MSIRVLVIDDSAIVRQVAAAMLASAAGVEVTTAADPLIALEKMARGPRPDVILLDLEMPRMDGLTFLKRLMRTDPLPVVVVTASAEGAMRALDAGALSVVTKPQLDVRGFLEESRELLLEAVLGAAQARLRSRPPAGTPASDARPRRWTDCELIAIGASTGGPDALLTVLEPMPAELAPIVVVQHMPAAFTGAFARRLGQACRRDVREAEDGLELRRGLTVIARGDQHLVVERAGLHLVARLSSAPPVCRHRPSVDVLFESVARTVGAAAMGVLLTGMGDDGARGLASLRQAGAFTVAQDEASCVVFGMPKEAIARGAAVEVLPLRLISAAIARRGQPPG